MSHNRPKPNQFHWYCKNTAKGSVADAFRNFDESILPEPGLKEKNKQRYREFCAYLNNNPEWRYHLYANSGFRYRKEFEK